LNDTEGTAGGIKMRRPVKYLLYNVGALPSFKCRGKTDERHGNNEYEATMGADDETESTLA